MGSPVSEPIDLGLRSPVQGGVWLATHRGLAIVVVDLRDEPEDAFDHWVTEAGVQLFATLRLQLVDAAEPPGRVCVVVVQPAEAEVRDRPALEAAFASARGAVLSLAVERSGTLMTLLHVCAGDVDKLRETLDYLAVGDSAYVTGLSLDLRGPP
jgi:hypothetical protein